jgi:hypothetical protein
MFDETTKTDNDLLEEMFLEINPNSEDMINKYYSCLREAFEKKFKQILFKLIVGDDKNNEKKNRFYETICPCIEGDFLDRKFIPYKKTDGIEKAIRKTFENIRDNEKHNYYIDGGVRILEYRIGLNLTIDDFPFPIEEMVKRIFSLNFEEKYNQMMKNDRFEKAIIGHKNLIVYKKFHNVDTLPLAWSYFDYVGLDGKNPDEMIEKALKDDDKNVLKSFHEKNPFIIYSNRVFDRCAYWFAENCFGFFYDLISTEEMALENNFFRHASSNLGKDIRLNYAGLELYKPPQKAQDTVKPPNQNFILSMSKSIICESVFSSALDGGVNRRDPKGMLNMIRFLMKNHIVLSDVTKYNFSKAPGSFTGYASKIDDYLNKCLR